MLRFRSDLRVWNHPTHPYPPSLHSYCQLLYSELPRLSGRWYPGAEPYAPPLL
jgi:hypothetical protein